LRFRANAKPQAAAVHKSVITSFLRGGCSFTVETVHKLLAALGCEIEVRGPKAAAPPAKAKGRQGSEGKPNTRPTKG